MKARRRMKGPTSTARSPKRRELPVAWDPAARFNVPIPPDEAERLANLHAYEVLDTPPEEVFNNVAQLAAQICQAPIAMVSLVDSDRQWFKAKVGLSASETARDIAFCAHAIMQRRVFVVTDALTDERFAHNPLVTSEPKIRFYAGAPLLTPDDHAIGTLCVLDRVPRQLAPEQAEALCALSRQVIAQLELRRRLLDSEQALATARKELKGLRNRLNLLEATQKGVA